MNYAAFHSFDDLWLVASKGVYREWFYLGEALTEFGEKAKTTLEFLYGISKDKKDVQFCPQPENIFEPFKWLRPYRGGSDKQVKVIITGQDPYHSIKYGVMDAVGIAFQSPARYTPQSAMRLYESLVKYGHIPSDMPPLADYRSWLPQHLPTSHRVIQECLLRQ